MRIDFNISQTEAGKFRTACEAVIRNVGEGTKAAVTDACISIMSDSFSQVPVDTGTLYDSAFFGVSRRTDVKNYRYGALMGYGDFEGLADVASLGPIEWLKEPNNGVNPKNGYQASTYAAKVHEDLDMPHPNGGKAKFLEDPVRNWAAGRFARTAMTYWSRAISYVNRGHFGQRYVPGNRYRSGQWKTVYNKYARIEAHTKFVERGSTIQRGGEYSNRG